MYFTACFKLDIWPSLKASSWYSSWRCRNSKDTRYTEGVFNITPDSMSLGDCWLASEESGSCLKIVNMVLPSGVWVISKKVDKLVCVWRFLTSSGSYEPWSFVAKVCIDKTMKLKSESECQSYKPFSSCLFRTVIADLIIRKMRSQKGPEFSVDFAIGKMQI